MLLEILARDLRVGLRTLRREISATVCFIAIAGLGVGASLIVLSVWRAVVLRPLPFAAPDQLAWIANGTSEDLSDQTVQVGNFEEMRATSRAFVDIAGFDPFYAPGNLRLTGTGEPERLTGVSVTQGFFALLGVQPMLGRSFDASESRWRAPRTVVLSHSMWLRRFGGERGVIGRAITLNDEPATIIGVLPASFDFAAAFTPGRRVDVFTPFPLSAETHRRGNTLALIGRLRDGVALATAQAEASVIGRRIADARLAGARRNSFVPHITTLHERVSGRFQSVMLMLASAVAFLMLLVCANLCNLLLVRASRRRGELAVRAALGASQGRLIVQLVVESLLLCSGAAALGLLLAIVGTSTIARIEGTTIPLLGRVGIDAAVLVLTLACTLVASVGFGLLTALHDSRRALSAALADGARGSTSRRGRLVRQAIVVTEVALVCVLLTGAGLLTRSLERVLAVQPGFMSDEVLTVRVDPRRMRRAESSVYFDALLREVATVPGVSALGLTDALPLGDNFGWRRWGASPAELSRDIDDPVEPLVRMVDEGYFAAMRIPLRSGRALTIDDDSTSEPVIVINERLASVLWPDKDPVGRMLRTEGRARRVVGVVANVRYFGLDRPVDAEMYMPMRTGDYESVDLVVRGSIAPDALARSVRAALRRADPNLPIAELHSMQRLIDRSLFPRRMVVLIVAGFAVFGLVVAALGIYAVVAYSVAQRTQEMGVRLALGATPRRLQQTILAETGRLLGLGLVIGVPTAWTAAHAIRGLLFEVGSTDPATLVAVLLLLAAVAAFAGYVPARRATRVDPAIALRGRL